MKFFIPHQMLLREALRLFFPDSSRRTLQQWLKAGRFLLDGEPLEREDHSLQRGETLSFQKNYPPQQRGRLKILFANRSFVVIDKPTGLLSVPLDEPSLDESALRLLRRFYPTDQIYPVHRIDREASGVLLFARGAEMQEQFKELFARHDLKREYFAIVEGRLAEERGTWRCFLKERPDLQVIVAADGQEAITHFEVLHRSPKYTYLRLQLETGRKHQIRVHCQQAGAPILGDRRYGALENPLGRLALHAKELSFLAPLTKRPHRFTSPLPFAFKKLGATDQNFR